MKVMTAMLALLLLFPAQSLAAELVEYQKRIDELSNELAEMKQFEEFLRQGFEWEVAAAWMQAVQELAADMEGRPVPEAVPEAVREAPQALVELAEAYLDARRYGFKNLAALDYYEETICEARIRISNALDYLPEPAAGPPDEVEP